MVQSGASAAPKSAKPVTPLERLWRVAERKGELEQRAVLVAWQRELGAVPPSAVVSLALTAFSEKLLQAFKQRRGLRWDYGGETLELAENALVPCRRCGRIFESQAPRFGVVCDDCVTHGQRSPPRPPAGDLQMFSGGFYDKGPLGPSWGYSHFCKHPDCVAFFLADRSQERYCPAHKNRTAAKRARERETRPKHQRFRLVAAEPVRVTYHLEDGSARLCAVGPSGYQAEDSTEFEVLLGQPMIDAEKL